MTLDAGELQGLGLADAVRRVSVLLSHSGIESADSDARMLVLAAAGRTRSDLILKPAERLDEAAGKALAGYVARRISGEPPTRILGARAFWTLDLRVTPDVLDPRPDSETIVRAALDATAARQHDALRVLDLGTGSGALLLAILSERPNATGVGVDLSPGACAIARENAERNGLADRTTIQQGCWTDELTERFDLIVSNPPYIESAAIPDLSEEVRRHDPGLALNGGVDGLAAYRDIVVRLPAVLATDGVAVLELGIGQGADVAGLAAHAGLIVRGFQADLAGIDRALVLAAAR